MLLKQYPQALMVKIASVLLSGVNCAFASTSVDPVADQWAQHLQQQCVDSGQFCKVDLIGRWAATQSELKGDRNSNQPILRSSLSESVELVEVTGEPVDSLSYRYRFKVRQATKVWVSGVNIRPGDPVDCGQVSVRNDFSTTRKVSIWSGPCLGDKPLVAKRWISAFEPILAADVQAKPMVMDQKVAQASVSVGVIKVDAQVIALADGAMDQLIPVRLLSEGRGSQVLKARVTGPGTVAIVKE